jgi:hypothetical protein
MKHLTVHAAERPRHVQIARPCSQKRGVQMSSKKQDLGCLTADRYVHTCYSSGEWALSLRSQSGCYMELHAPASFKIITLPHIQILY